MAGIRRIFAQSFCRHSERLLTAGEPVSKQLCKNFSMYIVSNDRAQTKGVQAPTETPPLKRAKHQSATVLDDIQSSPLAVY